MTVMKTVAIFIFLINILRNIF